MVIDLSHDHEPAKVLMLFLARGMHLGAKNPSIDVLLAQDADDHAAANEVYGRLRIRTGLNSRVLSIAEYRTFRGTT